MLVKKLKKLLYQNINKSTLKPVGKEESSQMVSISDRSTKQRMRQINRDFKQAFKLLRQHQNTVTFFGAVHVERDSQYYNMARELAEQIVRETGASIVTGGGPGIMEAANRGAADEQGNSIGMTIHLPREQVTNEYVNRSVDFYYFFSRKVALSFAARAYVYFPGGFGTLDEFFEILTLKQTEKIKPLPIILMGSDYWRPLDQFIRNTLLEKFGTIKQSDIELYYICDDIDEAVDIIKESK